MPPPSRLQSRALVLEGPRDLSLRTFDVPDIGDDDAVIRVEACGLCGTDHEQYSGALHGGFAFVPGHETVGVLEQLGPVAAERWGVAEGDRVAVEVFQSCRECDACVAGEYRRCRAHGIGDMYGFIPAERAPSLWGGYADYQYLGPDALVLPVPAELDPVMATLFNPLGAGIRWGVTVPGTKPGDVVAVLGPGIRGLCAAAAAKDAGAEFVMVTGYGPRDAERLALATEFGADLAIDVATHDPVKELRRHVRRGADVVVDVTAKAPTAFQQAIDLAASAGTVVVAGTRGHAGLPEFNPDSIVFKELTIKGALGVDATAYRAALSMLVEHRYPFDRLPRQVVGLGDVEGLLQTLAGDTDAMPPVHGVLVP